METTEALIANPKDYNARAEFAWASTCALNGFTYVGTAGFGANHMIGSTHFLRFAMFLMVLGFLS